MSHRRTIYTCALNDRGGVEIDLTVTPIEAGIGELHDPIFKGRGKNSTRNGGVIYHLELGHATHKSITRHSLPLQAITASLVVHQCITQSLT